MEGYQQFICQRSSHQLIIYKTRPFHDSGSNSAIEKSKETTLYRHLLFTDMIANPRAWEGQRSRCPRFAVVWATRTLPLPGIASASTVCVAATSSASKQYMTGLSMYFEQSAFLQIARRSVPFYSRIITFNVIMSSLMMQSRFSRHFKK